MKTIILTEKHFDADGNFNDISYYNESTDQYEFKGNLKINVTRLIYFDKSIFVKGNQIVKGGQIVEGNQIVKGYQIVKDYQTIKGNQIVKRDQIVEGNQIVKGYQIVEGDQTIKGDQTVKGDRTIRGLKLLKQRGSITFNHIGSRSSRTIFLFTLDKGIWVKCGCFFNNIDNFEKRVKEVHINNQYAVEYLNAIEYAKKMYEYYLNLEKSV